MKTILILIFVTSTQGCSTLYPLQNLLKNTQKSSLSMLSLVDKLEVVPAQVNNPYPECSPDGELRRVADLSVERSERVYLQGGNLCQRSK